MARWEAAPGGAAAQPDCGEERGVRGAAGRRGRAHGGEPGERRELAGIRRAGGERRRSTAVRWRRGIEPGMEEDG